MLPIHRKALIATALASVVLLPACDDGTDTFFIPSSLTVVSTAAPEGAPGEMSQLRFRVTMTEPQVNRVLISYTTEAATATAGEDFLATSGEVEIPAGAIEATIPIDIMGDGTEEDAETFMLNYSTVGNVTPTANSAIGTIANDDSDCSEPFTKDPNPWRRFGEAPLNFAHRGGVTDFPENTLYAYAEAARAGADVLEMDVYQTKDNELVVLHDLDVDRTTNGEGNVVDLTLAETARTGRSLLVRAR